MSFTEKLNVLIDTQLDAGAFKELQLQLRIAKAAMSNIMDPIEQGEGLARMVDQAEQVDEKLSQVNLKPRGGEGQAAFTDTETGAPVSEEQARMRKFRDEMQKSKVAAANLSEQADTISFSRGISSADRMQNAMSESMSKINEMETPQIDANVDRGGLKSSFAGEAVRKAGFSTNVGSTQMERSLEKVRQQATPTTRSLRGTGSATGRVKEAFRIAKIKASNFEGSIARMIPSLQSLQMTLLGVQFQLLSLAFIFGGLMMSALGAVGIFEILGNTLKMFFLPTALELLPVVLDIRDALLNVDEETKKTIGSIFAGISAFAALGSILAFVTNGFLSVLTVVKGLFAPLFGIAKMALMAKTGTSSLSAALSAFGSGGIIGGLKAVGSSLASLTSYIPHIAALIAIVVSLVTIFQRFPGITSAIVEKIGYALDFIGLLFSNLKLRVTGALNVIQGVVTAVLALLQGDTEKFVKGLKEAFLGLSQIFIKPFFNFLNFLVDTVLPGVADFATMIPKLIVKGMMGIGSVLSDALKAALPDFLWNQIKGLLSGAGDIGDVALDVLNAPKEMAEKFSKNTEFKAPKIGQDFKPTGNNNKKETKVQENNINANVEVNDKEETPQETGRQFGQGLSGVLNSRQSDIASGT